MLQRILGTIRKQLGLLTVSQRLLIGSLAVLILMTMFLVSQYASSPKMVELIPTGTPEDQQKVASHLDGTGVAYQIRTGKVFVAAESKYPALAQLAKAQALPSDKKLMFASLVGTQNWLMPASQINAMNTIALSNELSSVIRNFPGIDDASVFISSPDPRGGGIGSAYRKPVAQVTVFPRAGSAIDQSTVNALADLVAGSTAGMDARDVAIIDGTNRRSHRAVAPDDVIAGNYVEHVAKVESRVRDKIEGQLRFIDDVIVSVNAMVDASRRQVRETKVLDKGAGTVVLPIEESSTNSTNASGSKGRAAEPGLASNVAADINNLSGSGSGSTSSNDETSTVKSEVRFGEKVTTQADATGKPTKINVTVSVPRDYVAEIVRKRKGAGAGAGSSGAAPAEPTEDEIKQEWESPTGLKQNLEQMIAPLIETEGSIAAGTGAAGAQVMAGTVRAFLIPVAMTAGRGGGGIGTGGAAASGGVMGTLSSLAGGGVLKNVLLGLLALLSVGLMLMMVRKSTRSTKLPTAEELVGIPPALQTGNDIVGEAEEGETAMTGIEVDAQALKTSKMLEEIGALVKSNPSSAAQVFNRWLSTEN